MKVLGIDPGTVSFDLCLMEDRDILFEESLSSQFVAERPEDMAQKCIALKPDLIVAPSGYGLPNRRLSEVGGREMFELTLIREGERVPVIEGMKKFFPIMAETNLDILFIPGIIQLPTVPLWRKFNRIDLGTADKLCIGVLSVETVSRKKRVPYSEVSYVVAELGGGYNSVITVQGGKIINGIGGTIFPGPGYMNCGAMDGELAYLLGGFEKTLLFEGGAGYLCSSAGPVPIEDFSVEKCPDAFKAFTEGVLLAICSQRALLPGNEVYLSGRLTRYPHIYSPVKARLEGLGYSVDALPLLSSRSKAAAQGCALVGNGLRGGCYEPLVKHMMITGAAGSVTDYIYWRKSWQGSQST